MIIFIYGQDSYRSQRKLNEIIDYYITGGDIPSGTRDKKNQKSGLNLKTINLIENNFQEFQYEIQSISMFEEKKLILLKNAFLNKDFKKEFLEKLKKIQDSKDIILFYEEGEISKDDPLCVFLKKISKSQEFKLLEKESLKNWIKKEFKVFGSEIEEIALEKLVDFVGNNLWQMENEIKKLVNYTKNPILGRGRKIESKDIDILIKPKIETDIFKTIDSLALKNKKQSLELLHKHLEKGDPPLYLLSMINFQFRNLLMIKSDESGFRKLKLHPYVIKKTRALASKFSLEELKKIYLKIFQIDLNIKTGKIDPQTSLDLLITEI